MENNLTMGREILKNEVFQSEKFDMNERRCYNVSVSRNNHQDKEKTLWSVVRSPMDA